MITQKYLPFIENKHVELSSIENAKANLNDLVKQQAKQQVKIDEIDFRKSELKQLIITFLLENENLSEYNKRINYETILDLLF
jgi:hypothetical protein